MKYTCFEHSFQQRKWRGKDTGVHIASLRQTTTLFLPCILFSRLSDVAVEDPCWRCCGRNTEHLMIWCEVKQTCGWWPGVIAKESVHSLRIFLKQMCRQFLPFFSKFLDLVIYFLPPYPFIRSFPFDPSSSCITIHPLAFFRTDLLPLVNSIVLHTWYVWVAGFYLCVHHSPLHTLFSPLRATNQ